MPPLIAFKVTVRDEELLAALRESSREMRRDVKDVMLRAAQRKAVPLANELAPSFARGHVKAAATTTTAYLTFRNGLTKMERARDGLMEFGGSIKTPLAPKKAHALRLADGSFVMSVKKPRRIKGKHYMQRAADESIPEFVRELEREIPRLIQHRIDSMARL